jgi:hypothetical protein
MISKSKGLRILREMRRQDLRTKEALKDSVFLSILPGVAERSEARMKADADRANLSWARARAAHNGSSPSTPSGDSIVMCDGGGPTVDIHLPDAIVDGWHAQAYGETPGDES